MQPDQKLSAYPALRDSADFHGKPYHSEIDAFYVEADRINDRTKQFTIAITEAYYQEYLTLFPEGNYPKLLPDPVRKLRMPPIHYEFPLDDVSPRYPQNPGKYNNSDFFYLWLNADCTRMIYLPVGLGGSVTRIEIDNEIRAAFAQKYIAE